MKMLLIHFLSLSFPVSPLSIVFKVTFLLVAQDQVEPSLPSRAHVLQQSSANFSVKSQIINKLGFMIYKAKSKLLYRYL